MKRFWIAVFLWPLAVEAGPVVDSCCYSTGECGIPIGRSWKDTRNGVSYECVCDSNGGTCTPMSSGGSSGGSYPGGGYGGRDAWQYQIMGSFLQAMMQGMMQNLFAPPQSAHDSAIRDAQEQARLQKARQEEALRQAKLQAQYMERLKQQIQLLEQEYNKKEKEEFARKSKALADKFSSRYDATVGKEERVATLHQLNCAAFNSLESARKARSEIGKLTISGNLNTSLESARSLSDFTLAAPSACPEIAIRVPEPGMPDPVRFQEELYAFVMHEAQELNTTFAQMKEKVDSADRNISALRTTLKHLEQQPNRTPESDLELLEAQKLFNDAIGDREMIVREINTQVTELDKKLTVLSGMRQQYDAPKPGVKEVKRKTQP